MTIHPAWIRTNLPNIKEFNRVDAVLRKQRLNTVCRSARCPNIGECFSNGHLTFMILGDICTRGCYFCSVKTGLPLPVMGDEAERIAVAVERLSLSYVIVTSVTRDDLPDGGAAIFSQVINVLRERNQWLEIEILTPDFQGDDRAVDVILVNPPDIWAHNLETVPQLYAKVRPQADYLRSLQLLETIKLKNNDILTKSGIMLGLGEEWKEVLAVLRDLRSIGTDIVTLGQYLQPQRDCLKVQRYITPVEFEKYQEEALAMGFKQVLSGPLVRSSYRGRK